MGRETTAAIVVLLVILVGALIAVAVLAIRLNDATKDDEAAESDKQEGVDFDTCDDVAIIGAGISGSYAAYRLREKGWKVSLYEYSNRIGGRIHTVKLPGIPDVNVELGATGWRQRTHRLFNATVNELGLEVDETYTGYFSGPDTMHYIRGERMKRSELHIKAPHKIPDEYRIDFSTFLWQVFTNNTLEDPDVDNPLTMYNRQRVKSMDGVELGKQSRALYNGKYFDSETIQYIADPSSYQSVYGENSAGAFTPLGDPSLPSTPNPWVTLVDGLQAMPEKMVERFLAASNKHKFLRNHHLKSIRKDDETGNQILSFQPTETKQGKTEDIKNVPRRKTCAKKVILAITQMGLQHLDWPVLKSGEVRDMLDNAVMPIVASKMYFGYDTAWWKDIPWASHHSISNTPIRHSMDFGQSKTSEKAVLNPSYTDTDGPYWRDIVDVDEPIQGDVDGDMTVSMSNSSVYVARRYYAETFNLTMDEMPQPNSAVMQIWDSYPIGASWYYWMPNYYWEDVEAKMRKPSDTDDVYNVGNIFSADLLGGACEGGLRMVDKLIPEL